MALHKYKIEGLDCANCAAKIEEKIKKIPQVDSATVSFFTQQLVLEADDNEFEKTLKKVQKTIKRIEPDCILEEI